MSIVLRLNSRSTILLNICKKNVIQNKAERSGTDRKNCRVKLNFRPIPETETVAFEFECIYGPNVFISQAPETIFSARMDSCVLSN